MSQARFANICYLLCYKSKKLGVPHIVASNGGNVLNVLT